jgi:hypothetical protein
METASTASTARNQKYSGEVSNISKPFIDDIYISSIRGKLFILKGGRGFSRRLFRYEL